MITAAVLGAGGYIGGELLRILLGHADVEVALAESRSRVGHRVDLTHPNLRGMTGLLFRPLDGIDWYDVLFLATPHREAMRILPDLADRAGTIIDLSGDFRLRTPADYARHYGEPHAAPDLLAEFVPGLPEAHRAELRAANRISVRGCMATAGILALLPAAEQGMVDGSVHVDARTGSSGAGSAAGPGNLHAERSGALRVFAPSGHRHEVEIAQATGLPVRMTASGVEAVRGVQVLCHARLADDVDEREVRRVYRERYREEPFVRIVAQRRGIHRLPEPKILAGSNFCDVGFAVDITARTVVFVAALDNLVKGGAGNAVQCMNIRFGLPERRGLEFSGLHPN